MAKKRKSAKMPNWLVFVPVLLAVVAVAMMFLVTVKYTGKLLGSEITYTGFETIFGYSEKVGSTSTQILGFSFLGLLTVLLPLVGAVLAVSKSKLLKLIGAVLSLAGTVLFFLMPNFVVFAEGVETIYKAYTASLGVGAIIAGVVSALSTLVIGYELTK